MTINNDTTSISTSTVAACDIYIWNGTTYSSSGVYTYLIANANGCDSTATLNLTINNDTTINNAITICQGEVYQIGSSYYNLPGSYYDILQTVNNCDSIVNTYLTVTPYYYNIQQIVLCEDESYQIGNNIYTTAGTYNDTLQLQNSCDSIVTTDISFSIVSAQIYEQNNNLFANTLSGTAPYTYLWSTGESSANINPLTYGAFWLLVTDAHNCISDTAYFVIDNVNAVEETNIINGLTIFPNPTDGLITIGFKSVQADNFSISILNVLGVVIFEEKLIKFSGLYQKQINLEEYSNAVYLIKIKTASVEINKKIILK